ncbi:MAG: HAMP domain-containing sensor histidine kinase [Acidobacteriota bacterium]
MFSDLLKDALDFVNEYRHVLMILTAAMAGFFAVVILILRYFALSAERWAKFFAWGFALLAIQYIIQRGGYHMAAVQTSTSAGESIYQILRVLNLFFSTANNLLFLAAAFDLLDRRPAVPKLAWCIAVLAILCGLPGDAFLWSRMPDALFSAACLGLVIYATFTNIGFRRRPILAAIAINVGSVYALVQVVYGFNPIIASSQWRWVIELMHQFDINDGPHDALHFLDALTILAAWPLKYGLFVSAFFLLMRTLVVVSSGDVKKMMSGITAGKAEYLEGPGIVRSIAESVGADRTELSLRLPGATLGRVKTLSWDVRKQSGDGRGSTLFPPTYDSIQEEVFETGQEFRYPRPNWEKSFTAHAFEPQDNHSSIVAVPIRFHGAVIGCLKVIWETAAYSATALQHIRQLADLVAPAVQSNRELAALDQLGYGFSRLQVEQPMADIERSVEKMTQILHDVLSPLGTCILVDKGFRSFRKIEAADPAYRDILQQDVRGRLNQVWSSVVDDDGHQTTEIARSHLVAMRSAEPTPDVFLGELILLVPSGLDEVSHPSLGTNYVHRRAVASLVSDALLDSARKYFDDLLKELGVRLNQKEATNVAAWFKAVQEIAGKAGLRWVVSTQPGTEELLGDEEAIAIVKSLGPGAGDGDAIALIHQYSEGGNCNQLVRITLPNTKGRVWMGVEREGFGPELTFHSPWSLFLEYFGDIADSALVRITAAIEFQRLQADAAQYQGLATVAVTTGTLIHQLTNMVKGLQGPASTLKDAVALGRIECDEQLSRLIALMSDSTTNLLQLLSPIANVTKLDAHRPCSLADAAQHARKLFEVLLSQRQIALTVTVAPDLVIDVPFHVAGLALANLVHNASDALSGAGTIRIDADDVGDVVLCHVTDDGPGVANHIRDRIFELGETTKPGSGGWGLYLVDRSLRENRAGIELTNPGPGGTRFTIRFPKPRPEDQI